MSNFYVALPKTEDCRSDYPEVTKIVNGAVIILKNMLTCITW